MTRTTDIIAQAHAAGMTIDAEGIKGPTLEQLQAFWAAAQAVAKPVHNATAGPDMSAETLYTIKRCIDLELKNNEKLHWAVVGTGYRDGESTFSQKARTEVIRDIANDGNRLSLAHKELSMLWATQYPEEAARMREDRQKEAKLA